MKYHRTRKFLLNTGYPLLFVLALSPGVAGAESVLIQDEEGVVEMLGNAGWRKGKDIPQAPALSLLFDNPQQRTSAKWRRGPDEVTGFGLPVPATDPPLGTPGSETDEPRGISWSTSPARLPSEQLTVTGTYVHRSEDDSPDDASPAGSAGAVAVDSSLPARGAVHLHGELAYSNFDADGGQSEFGAEAGRAFGAEISYGSEVTGWSGIRLDAGFREVGPGFRSIANPALRDDRQRTHLGADLRRRGFSLWGEASRTVDNFSASSAAQALETDSFELRADYAPSSNSAARDGPLLFNKPRIRMGLSRNHTENLGHADVRPTDREKAALDALVTFSPGPVEWSLGRSISREEDYTDFHLDHLTRKNQLRIALPLHRRAYLSAALEHRGRTYQNGYGLGETSAAFRLNLSGENGARCTLALKLREMASSDGNVDETRLSAEARFHKALPALPGDPNVWIGGSYETLASRSGGRESGYRIFFGLELKLGTG